MGTDSKTLQLLKEALEDGAFPFAYPEEYALVKNLLKQKKHETELRLQKMYRSLTRNLADAGVIFGTGFAPFTGGPLNFRSRQ